MADVMDMAAAFMNHTDVLVLKTDSLQLLEIVQSSLFQLSRLTDAIMDDHNRVNRYLDTYDESRVASAIITAIVVGIVLACCIVTTVALVIIAIKLSKTRLPAETYPVNVYPTTIGRRNKQQVVPTAPIQELPSSAS